MGEDLLTQVDSDERWTRVCERLREIMSVCECLRVLGGLSEAGFVGFIGIFRMGEDLLTQVGSYERLREITSVCECLRVLGGLSGAGFAGFIGIFRMARALVAPSVGPSVYERHERLRVFTCVRTSRICGIYWDESLYERLREIMSVCECLRVLGGLSGAGFAGFIGIFRMAGVPPALVRSDERWTRV